MDVIYILLMLCFARSSALDFNTLDCEDDNVVTYTGQYYIFRDKTNSSSDQCRAISDLTLPVSTDYTIQVDLRSVNGSKPGVMFNIQEEYEVISFSRMNETGICVLISSMVEGTDNETNAEYCSDVIIDGDEWFHVEMNVSESTVTVTINDSINMAFPTLTQLEPSVGLTQSWHNSTECEPKCVFHFRNLTLVSALGREQSDDDFRIQNWQIGVLAMAVIVASVPPITCVIENNLVKCRC